MNPPMNAMPEMPIESQGLAPATLSATRPLYWSVRRELWENRSIYLAPLAVAGVALLGLLIATTQLPGRLRAIAALDPVKQQVALVKPYSLAASMILMAGIIVGVVYCLDALSSERRDRSILFWKSLPVSDRTTVLSKASIPIVVQPLLSYLIAQATMLVTLFASSTVLLASGTNPVTLWSRLPLFQMPLVMLYGVTAHALWFAPIYAWLLLVSSLVRRATFLWAALPFFALYVIERLALGTTYIPSLLKYRVMGAMAEAFSVNATKAPIIELSQLDPLRFLSSPGLWIGLVLAAAFLTAALHVRRNREPI
jgi:ABC-2 type transport system permease protein